MPKRPFDSEKREAIPARPAQYSDANIIKPHPSRGQIIPPSPQTQRPYQQRYSQTRPQSQFRCLNCGNWRIEAFGSVYSRQTSISKFKRGLILKTGWSQTRRQTDLAVRCAPPRKRAVWWGILIALVAVAVLRYVPTEILGVVVPSFTLPAFIVLTFGVLVTGYAIYWNRVVYPKVLYTWENSYYCSRCDKATIITPEGRFL